MKRKSITSDQTDSIKKVKDDKGFPKFKKVKDDKGFPKFKKAKDGKAFSKIKKESGDVDITASLTDTHIKSKNFRFEKSGGKRLGKFKQAETPKKPNWNEFKQQKKEVAKKRKMTCSHYDIIVESKKIWEQVRRADCPDVKKDQLIKNLHKMVKGKMAQIVFSHDMSRIIQWLLKLSPTSIKNESIAELLPCTVQMIKSKYSNVIVKHMLKYGDEKIKSEVINEMTPHVVTLLSHTTASPILMYAYDQVATPEQKVVMRQELYGGLYKSSQGDKIDSLEDIFKQSPEMKTAILSVTKTIVTKSLQKAHVTGSALLHTVLLDYINHSNDTDLTEVLEMLAALPILQFIYTKPGASVVMHIIWNSTNKLKKQIIKELKGHIKQISTSEFGHLALVTLFDNIDDTVLLKKAILSELLTEVESVVANEYGRKVVAHLVSWCDSHFFHPSCAVTIKQGDDFATRKKDREIRNKEILDSVSELLLNCISNNPEFWVSTSSIAMVTAVILKCALGTGLKEALDSIATIIVDIEKQVELEVKKIEKGKPKDPKGKTQEPPSIVLTPFIEHPGFHSVLKKIIQHDKENAGKNQPTLSECIVSKLTNEILEKWIECNRACFILVSIIETEVEPCSSDLKTKLQPYKKKLGEKKFKGANILVEKLK